MLSPQSQGRGTCKIRITASVPPSIMTTTIAFCWLDAYTVVGELIYVISPWAQFVVRTTLLLKTKWERHGYGGHFG